MKKVLSKSTALILILVLCTAMLASCSKANSEANSENNMKSHKSYIIQEKNFASPEEAIEHFVNKIAENNVAEAFEACALSSYADGFDARTYYATTKAMYSTYSSPSEYDFYKQSNYFIRLGDIAFQAKIMVYSLVLEDEFPGTDLAAPFKLESEDKMDLLIENMNPEKIKNLNAIAIAIPQKARQESMMELSRERAARYGADDETERAVLYDLDGVKFFGGFTLLRYGKNWRILWPTSMLTMKSRMGNLSRTNDDYTPEEFVTDFENRDDLAYLSE